MTPQPISASEREQLRIVSGRLLLLHKLLLDLQRAEYEQRNRPIVSTGEFLNLVLTDDSFEWLRRLSGAIVQIDEIVAPRSKAAPEDADAAIAEVRKLLMPSQDGTAFQRNYWRAIQGSPEVLIAHRETVCILKEYKSASVRE